MTRIRPLEESARALVFAGVAVLCAGCTAGTRGASVSVPAPQQALSRSRAALGKVSVSVGSPVEIRTPAGFQHIPDEYTSMLAVGSVYRFFVAGHINNAHGSVGVLDTSDFIRFRASPGYREPAFAPPAPHCSNDVFDAYYAASGSVLPDPVQTGTLLMVYHAENHYYGPHVGCVGEVPYSTVGLTQSTDGGKTWATGVAIVGGPDPKPSSLPVVALGAGAPSATVDTTNAYLYVYFAQEVSGQPEYIGAARASVTKLGTFNKWYHGGFTSPGIGDRAFADSVFGSKTGICDTTENIANPGISYNDALGLYLLTMTCIDLNTGRETWAFSTAASLDLQDWTAPQPIAGSEKLGHYNGYSWYPALMTPGAQPGHTGASGYAIYGRGTLRGTKRPWERPFTVTAN